MHTFQNQYQTALDKRSDQQLERLDLNPIHVETWSFRDKFSKVGEAPNA
jgi:hypothetical protein